MTCKFHCLCLHGERVRLRYSLRAARPRSQGDDVKKLRIAVLLLVILVPLVLWLSLDAIAKRAIEEGTRYATGEPSRLGDVRLGIFSGEVALRDLRVANPEGYQAEQFFVLDALDLAVHPRSLLDKVVRVPRLAINGAQVNIERQGTGSNAAEILGNIRRLGGAEEKQRAKGQKRFIVDQLRIDGVEADALFAPALGEGGRTRVQVPTIELRDIGAKSGGVTAAQLAGIVARAMLEQVVNSGALPAQFQAQLGEAIGAVQGLEGRIREETQQQRERLQDEAERAVEEQRKRLLEEGRRLFE